MSQPSKPTQRALEAVEDKTAEHVQIIKRGIAARVAEIRRDLAHWLEQTVTRADYTEGTSCKWCLYPIQQQI
jgi:hypothetical protein